jgi:hypothetical protein
MVVPYGMSRADQASRLTSDQYGRDLQKEDRMPVSVAGGITSPSRGRPFVVTNEHRGRFPSVIVRKCD